MKNTVNRETLVSEFPSVRSKAPHTISIHDFINTVRSDRFRQAVQDYRRLKALPGHEAEAQKLKDGMPCIIPAGVCSNGHAVKDLQQHSELLCIDLDHSNERTREIFLLSQSLPFVAASFISISEEGNKMLIHVRPEDVQKNYEQLYTAVGRAVSAHVGHPYDDKCKILTQPCFYSWHPEAYYNPDAIAFEMPAESETKTTEAGTKTTEAGTKTTDTGTKTTEAGTKATEAGTKATEAGTKATEAGTKATIAPDSPLSENGFIANFLDEFEHRNPFIRGSRNDLALKLGRAAASKGFSQEETKKLTELFAQHYAASDFTMQDIQKRVTSGYQFIIQKKKEEKETNRCHFGASDTYTPISAANEEESPEEVLEKNNELRASSPYIPEEVYTRLPEFLKRCCTHATDKRERDLMLLGSMNSCSALFPHVSFFYKKSLLSPHFYLAVVAPAGAGKGALGFTSILLDATQEFYERLRREQKKEYEQKLLAWEQEQQQARHAKRLPQLDLKPEEPQTQYLKISATTSKSRLIQSLATAGEIGCCMTTTEINTLVSSLGQDCGKYEDILCKAAHHEEVSSSYKIDGDPIVVRHPHLALCIAGTQEQFRSFFRSLEAGLYSRFGIYTRQQSQLWESCAPQEGEVDLHSHFYELGKELFEMHKLLLQSPTLVTFSPEQWQQHTAHFSLLLKRTLLEGRESSSGIVYRNGLLAMRLAAILTIFRKYADYAYAKEYRCTDDDFRTAMDIAHTLLEHSLLLSTSLPDTSLPPVSMHKFHQLEDTLASLPRVFTYMDFVRAVQEKGASVRTGKRWIQKAVQAQLIMKEGDNYKKRNKKSTK